jgi:hypothetical protein
MGLVGAESDGRGWFRTSDLSRVKALGAVCRVRIWLSGAVSVQGRAMPAREFQVKRARCGHDAARRDLLAVRCICTACASACRGGPPALHGPFRADRRMRSVGRAKRECPWCARRLVRGSHSHFALPAEPALTSRSAEPDGAVKASPERAERSELQSSCLDGRRAAKLVVCAQLAAGSVRVSLRAPGACGGAGRR